MFGQSPFSELQSSVSWEIPGRGSRSHRKLAFKYLPLWKNLVFKGQGACGMEEKDTGPGRSGTSHHHTGFVSHLPVDSCVRPSSPPSRWLPTGLLTRGQWTQPALARVLPGDSARVLRQRWRDRDRDAETERHTDRNTETQRDRQTETERDCDRDRQRDRDTEMEAAPD